MLFHSHHKRTLLWQSLFILLLLFLTEHINVIAKYCSLFFLSPAKYHAGFLFLNRGHCRRYHTVKLISYSLTQCRKCFENISYLHLCFCFFLLNKDFILLFSQCLITPLHTLWYIQSRSCIHFLVLFPFAYCKLTSLFHVSLFLKTYEILLEQHCR